MEWAYELAAKLGYFDVEGMLASGEPGQLAYWREYYEKHPFDYGPASLIVANLLNFIKVQLAPFTSENGKIDKKDLFPHDYFIPKFNRRGRRAKARGGVPQVRAKSLEGFFKTMARV
jgi:hypothetical protein